MSVVPSHHVQYSREDLEIRREKTSRLNERVSRMREFWRAQLSASYTFCWVPKESLLPIVRVKKIMKLDEMVKMISCDAPIILSKAIEMFISELSTRAWILADDGRRKTLQRSDVFSAIAHCPTYDFLVDIGPREDRLKNKKTLRASFNYEEELQSDQGISLAYSPNTELNSLY
eukprot:gene6620-7695_t